jgi:hypothetical protein
MRHKKPLRRPGRSRRGQSPTPLLQEQWRLHRDLGGGGGLEDESNVRGAVMTPNDEEERLRKERLIESLKLEFEMHKHITTVLAALAVVLLTIVQGFFPTANIPILSWDNFFLIGCFVLLFISGVWAILAMRIVLREVSDPDRVDDENRRLRAIIPGATLLGGLALFFVFAIVYMMTRL